ncbi:hypothetical protein NHE_0913 [Neorickettsia helminthoeca str. Oregon]|uniref:Uncharacterized protein n=1 Tax=Neorickettsia helminthoeca str. Oregon TaxID=1286528 RepID=X5GXQ0_9RICK|nr:hypothetical protein NHE_0913 [Neorickettsia helminthoeca str. Oregon]
MIVNRLGTRRIDLRGRSTYLRGGASGTGLIARGLIRRGSARLCRGGKD